MKKNYVLLFLTFIMVSSLFAQQQTIDNGNVRKLERSKERKQERKEHREPNAREKSIEYLPQQDKKPAREQREFAQRMTTSSGSLMRSAPATVGNKHDVKKVYEFLVQPSATIGSTNAEVLGISIPSGFDTTTANTPADWAWLDPLTANWNAQGNLTSLSLGNKGIAGNLDLSGCTALEYLSCYSNQLTALNVSGCTALQTLSCYSNQLTTLDVSGLANLQDLYCYNNQLTTLDVSGLTNLQALNCSGNQLTALNVSGLANLQTLKCSGNQLTALNVSGCTALVYLSCSGNQLPTLDVSGLANLQTLYCYYNQLTALNVSGCTALSYLSCYGNQLTTLNVSGCTALSYFSCENNQLTTLDVSGLTNLQTLYCNNNRLPTLDVSGLTNLIYLNCNNNKLTFSSLPVFSGGAYTYSPQAIMQKGKHVYNEVLDLSNEEEINGISTVYTWFDMATGSPTTGFITLEAGKFTFDQSLSGKHLRCQMTNTTFPSLTLECEVFLVEEQDSAIFNTDEKEGLRNFLRQPSAVSGKANLEVLGLLPADTVGWTNNTNEDWVTKIIGIQWENNESVYRVQEISWDNKKIAGTLDARKWMNLEYLSCYSNQLTTLNVSGLANLQELYCFYNQLTTLNVSGLANLQELSCFYNLLTTLNVSGLTNLEYLDCEDNQLTTLNVSGLTNLQTLYCDGNQLTSLNVSGLANLQELYCDDNQLTTLYVSGLTNLEYLNCEDNQLTTLNVSGLTNLQTLSCGGNQLTTLNVSGLTNLQTLSCSNNKLKFSSLPVFSGSSYTYSPQDTARASIYFKTDINLASEVTIEGVATVYNWYDITTGIKTALTLLENNGIFTVDTTFIGKTLFCEMTNTTFPDLTSCYQVTITDNNVTGVTLNTRQLSIAVNATGNLSATVLPDYAGNKNIVWTSCDNNIASVNEQGVVTGKAVGTTHVIVTTEEGGYKDTCTVTVTAFTTVTVNTTETGITVYPNPTKGQLVVDSEEAKFGASQLEIGNIQLFDLTGKLVFETKKTSFSIEHLPSGIYLVLIHTNKKIIAKKVIKN